MFKYQVREETDKNTWESFLLSQNPGTFLQSWNWGETNRLVGYKVIRLGAYKGKILSAVAQLIHQPAKRGPHYLIPGGPVVNYENGELVKVLLDYVRKVARENGAWFVTKVIVGISALSLVVGSSLLLSSIIISFIVFFTPFHSTGYF